MLVLKRDATVVAYLAVVTTLTSQALRDVTWQSIRVTRWTRRSRARYHGVSACFELDGEAPSAALNGSSSCTRERILMALLCVRSMALVLKANALPGHVFTRSCTLHDGAAVLLFLPFLLK